jgi:hypothetical protein
MASAQINIVSNAVMHSRSRSWAKSGQQRTASEAEYADRNIKNVGCT